MLSIQRLFAFSRQFIFFFSGMRLISWFMVTRDVLKVLKLHSPTARAILRTFKTSLVPINHEMHSRSYDFLYLSALCCCFEKWNTSDNEVKNIPLLFSISDWSILFENQWQASNFFFRRRLTERSKMINVCSLECYLIKHYPLSLVTFKGW